MTSLSGKPAKLVSIVSSTAVFCISIVPKVQTKHITSKRFQLLQWRCNETKIEREGNLIQLCMMQQIAMAEEERTDTHYLIP